MFERVFRYGQETNSHDWLKVIATILMIIDHLGFYVFDNNPWCRLLGRGAAPLFFFAVGFAPHHRFSRPLLMYGAILTAVNAFFFHWVYGNILLSFLLIKALLHRIQIPKLSTRELTLIAGLLMASNLLISPYLEYGTSGLLIAMGARLLAVADPRGPLILSIAILHHFGIQAVVFHFATTPSYLIPLTGLFLLILWQLREYQFRTIQSKRLRLPVLVIARYSLPIYFWHLVGFKLYLLHHIFSHYAP